MKTLSKAAQQFFASVELTQVRCIESALVINYAPIGKHLREWDDSTFHYSAFPSFFVVQVDRERTGRGMSPHTRLRYLRRYVELGLLESPPTNTRHPQFRFPRALCDTWAALVYQRLMEGGMPLAAQRDRTLH